MKKQLITIFCAFALLVCIFASCNKADETIIEAANPEQKLQNPVDGIQEAATATSCTCLIYIRNRYVLPANPNSVSAKDYGYVLQNNGWVLKTTPAVGDIVIFNTNYSGINTTHGHIGVVKTVTLVGSGSTAYYTLKVQGASQCTANLITHCNCNNVCDMTTNVNTTTKKANIKYWRK